jgi:dipeptidyl aminopeptidase/acylaminoacyl peptidase
MHPLGTVTFKARDGRAIPTLLTIPRSKVSSMKNLPAIVMPHGGPASYDTIDFDYEAQAFAQQGYMVIKPQFRGSSGFGAEHELAGRGEWGKKMQDDLSDALNFLVGKGIVDPKRVCIVGSSYGGYAALAGGAYTPELYKCVVAINGVTELHAFKSWVAEERGRSSSSVEYWEDQFGGEEYTKAGAREASPAASAETFTAPVLLIHGKNDKVVPISQSELMYKALKKAKKSVEIIKLDGEDHHLSEGATRLQTLDASIKFVNQYIGG